jgi:hypothetical protein
MYRLARASRRWTPGDAGITPAGISVSQRPNLTEKSHARLVLDALTTGRQPAAPILRTSGIGRIDVVGRSLIMSLYEESTFSPLYEALVLRRLVLRPCVLSLAATALAACSPGAYNASPPAASAARVLQRAWVVLQSSPSWRFHYQEKESDRSPSGPLHQRRTTVFSAETSLVTRRMGLKTTGVTLITGGGASVEQLDDCRVHHCRSH